MIFKPVGRIPKQKKCLYHCLHLLFIAGIQMEADANYGCHERIMLLCVYEHLVLIIEYAVVDMLRGGTLVIDLLIGICAAEDIGIKPDIQFRPELDVLSVFVRSTAVLTFGTVLFSIEAVPHKVTVGVVTKRTAHFSLYVNAFLKVYQKGLSGYG